LDDLTFIVEGATVTQTFSGSSLVGTGAANSVAVLRQISECGVLGTSSKGKVPVKPKLIARRSPEEAQFLEDLASYVAKSGATGRDEVFSFREENRTEVPLRSRTVREELKRTCESNGLPSAYFSSHSLRKGAITHMLAAGATEEDRRDRGNYSAGSQVMNQTYDYAVGLGPLP
jgi:Phage integrase family